MAGRDAGHAGRFYAAHPVVTAVDNYAVADVPMSADNDLRVIPVFLIDRAVPLDAPVHPHRLPAELVVGESVGRERQGRSPSPIVIGLVLPRSRTPVKWRISLCRERCPIEAAGTVALRPRVIQQRLIGDFPAEVRAAAKAGIGPVETL